ERRTDTVQLIESKVEAMSKTKFFYLLYIFLLSIISIQFLIGQFGSNKDVEEITHDLDRDKDDSGKNIETTTQDPSTSPHSK
ncbi:1781_t:CDS:2, partial [Entrophospora sp. SA101]